MLAFLLSAFSLAIKLLVTLLPVGPEIPASVDTFIAGSVATVKGMENLIGTSHALYCVIAVALYELGMAGFRSVSWAYSKVRG